MKKTLTHHLYDQLGGHSKHLLLQSLIGVPNFKERFLYSSGAMTHGPVHSAKSIPGADLYQFGFLRQPIDEENLT